MPMGIADDPHVVPADADAVFRPLASDDPREVSGYLLRARLGEGGMGVVYLSYTPGGRPVAFKLARSVYAADPEFRRRFAKEVAIAQRVTGLYTAPVIDCDPYASRPWLATAYVPAPSLAAAVGRQGPLPPDTVLVLIAGVAEALQSIHAAGVVHRDLKPGNVILAADGPRVIDFGISRAVESSSAPLTEAGARIGTPAFMAPEQVRGKSLGPAGDVFAVGSTAFYAVTGTLPFGGDAAVFHRILHEDPDWDLCPARVRGVLEPCLDKDPAARPTPTALIEMCRAASTDERLRIGEGWLPSTVTDVLTRYATTLAAMPPPPDPAHVPDQHEQHERAAPAVPTPAPQPVSTAGRRVVAFPRALFVAAVLLVAVVVGGLTASLLQGDDRGETPSTATRSPSPAPAGSANGTGPSPEADAGPATEPEIIRWQGRIGLDTPINLRKNPPEPASREIGTRIESGNFIQPYEYMSVWPEPGVPTRSQCDLRANTYAESDYAVPARQGAYICLNIGDGYTARVHLLSVASDGNGGEADVVVWEKND